MYNKLKNCLGVRLFTLIFKVMLERERSELSRASRNIKAILLKKTNSIVFRFLNVITGRVPVILVQQATNQVKKFAILLHKYRFRQDCRNASGNDCKRQRLSICCYFFKRMYHSGHSANSLRSKPSETCNCAGRSMIEMLGVLAIIAVLSVGGIAGYSKAMEKFKINKTIDAVAQIAVNIKTLYAQQKIYYGLGRVGLPNIDVLKIVVPAEMIDNSLSYKVRHPLNGQLAIYATGGRPTEVTETYSAFSIDIKGINKRACSELASFDWGKNDAGFIGLVVGVNMGNGTGTGFFENCDMGEKSNGFNNHYACRKDLPLSKVMATQWCDCGNEATCNVGLKFY